MPNSATSHTPAAIHVHGSRARWKPAVAAEPKPSRPARNSEPEPAVREDMWMIWNSVARWVQSWVARAARPFHSATTRLPAQLIANSRWKNCSNPCSFSRGLRGERDPDRGAGGTHEGGAFQGWRPTREVRGDSTRRARRGSSVLSQKFVVAPRTALRPPGKARRRSRIKNIRRGGVTQPGGMQRRPNANELLGQDTRVCPVSEIPCPPRRLSWAPAARYIVVVTPRQGARWLGGVGKVWRTARKAGPNSRPTPLWFEASWSL